MNNLTFNPLDIKVGDVVTTPMKGIYEVRSVDNTPTACTLNTIQIFTEDGKRIKLNRNMPFDATQCKLAVFDAKKFIDRRDDLQTIIDFLEDVRKKHFR